MAKRGRPSKYGPKLADELIAMAEAGAVDRQLAEKAGVSVATIRNWKKWKPEFGRRVRGARIKILKHKRRTNPKTKAGYRARRKMRGYVPPTGNVEISPRHEGLRRIGDWSRPCAECGTTDGPWRAEKHGRKLRRRARCGRCLGLEGVPIGPAPRDGGWYTPPGDVHVRVYDEDRERAGDWSRPCSKCGLTHETVFNTLTARDGKLHRKSVCRMCERTARYAMTGRDFLRMWEGQSHACAICLDPFEDETAAHIDHCHETGRIRGLLCMLCNTGVGKFRDNPDALENAAKYLRRGNE